MNKFKVGDKVQCIKESAGSFGVEGEVYTVSALNYDREPILAENAVYYGSVVSDRFELIGLKPPFTPEPVQFKIGDIAEAFGVQGIVACTDVLTYNHLTISVSFNGSYEYFTQDGRLHVWDKTPSLKLITRPKKKVTKTIECWTNVYSSSEHGNFFDSYEEARDSIVASSRTPNSNNYFPITTKLTGTYEIEE